MSFHQHAPLSFRPRAVTAPRLWLALLSLLALLAPTVAGADCVVDGTTVTCTGLVPNGFDADAPGLQVDVQPGATVGNGDPTPDQNALDLEGGNVVDVQAGAVITASGTGFHGIAALDGNTITNAGSIVVSGDEGSGIAAGDDNVEIRNEGSIDVAGAGGHGIAAGHNNVVRNPGSIVVTGAGGHGISVGNDSNVQSTGTVALSGGSNKGFFAGDNSDLRNRSGGIITAAGADSVGLEAGSNTSRVRNDAGAEIIMEGDNSVALKVGSNNNRVWNEAGGEITLEGNDSVGIQVGDDNSRFDSFALNEGIITADGDRSKGIEVGDRNNVSNPGTITITGADGIGMSGGDANQVYNSGTVEASGPGGIGVQLGTATGTGNTFENYGTITGGSGSGKAVSFENSGPDSENTLLNWTDAVIDGSASDVAILGSDGVEQILNGGTITGDVQLGAGDDVFTLFPGGGLDGAGVVQLGAGDDVFALSTGAVPGTAVDPGGDSDTLRLAGSGTDTLDLSILSEFVSAFERLDVASEGTWTLSGSGSLAEGTAVTSGTLALDGEVTLGGDYVQGAGTTLLVRVDPAGSNDRLVVDGNATIEEGAILQLQPTAPLIDEATYTFLTTTGTVTGLFDEVNFPADTGVLSFAQVATANRLDVEFSRFSYASAAVTGNQTATGIHLDEILAAKPADDSDMAKVLVSLDMLSSSELQAALDALHPEAYDAQANAILSFGRSVGELAAFRRPRCEEVVYERRPEIVAPSPCSRSWMPWGSAFGLFAKRDGKSGHIDFDQGGGGLLLGADHPLGERFLVYGFFGGGYTSVDVDAVGDGTLWGATVGAGARWSLGGTRIHGLLGYARGWHEQERNIDFGEGDWRIARTAKADYGSNLIMALVKAGHTFRFGSLDLEPLATVEYGYLMEDGFGESGAGDLDLDVDERSNSVLSTTLGARLAYTLFKWEYIGELLEWADGVWTPELTARWRGNWIGRERDLDARMVGAPAGVRGFTVGGQDAKQGVQVGAGVAFQPLRALMSIRLDYDGFYGDGSMVHRIGASIRIPLGGSAG